MKKGISLILLVITIVITIILAGAVVITLTNTGIIETAQNAVKKTNEQQLSIDVSTYLLMSGWINNDRNTAETFENYLKAMPGLTSVTKVASDAWEINREGTKIVVYQSGKTAENISVWDGTTSTVPQAKENNWYIYTAEQLKFFADAVTNKGLTAAQTTLVEQAGLNAVNYTMDASTVVHLMANIDLGARHNNGTYVTGTKWIPIGDGSAFKGKIDGHGHYITGMYVDYNKNYGGFICSALEISNLTIKDSYVKTSGGCAGGIVGLVTTITNCHNVNTTVSQTGVYGVGGIAGQVKSSINRCTNTGTVSTTTKLAAGLTSILSASGTITEGKNSGTITAEAEQAAGIVAQMNANTSATACTNTGAIKGGTINIGGIAGLTLENCVITNCENKGYIVSGNVEDTTFEDSQVGGIVGRTGISNQITNCNNFGNINGVKKSTGGVVGSLNNSSNLQLCTNTGAVNGTTYVGGIVGTADSTSSIRNSKNEGIITATGESLGGIAGVINPSAIVEQCSNSGDIEGAATQKYVGGIVGLVASDGDDPSIATISKISHCYNEGLVKGGTNHTAGICGYIGQYKSLIEKSYNIGEIQGKQYTAGIVGGMARGAEVANCYNAKTVSGTQYVAGIVGTTSVAGTTIRNITNVYNIATIKGTDYVGGLVGDNTNGQLTNACYLIGTASLDIGAETDTSLAQTAEYIKTTFLTTANVNGTIWEIRANENENYPVLVK